MKWRVFKFRPSSHSDDYLIIATYRDGKAAEKAKQALQRLLEDMRKNPGIYDTDWRPDDAKISTIGEKVFFQVYTAGYVDCVESIMKKVSKPVELERYQNYQELTIRVKAPRNLTPEAAVLILGGDEAEVIKWLIKNCGPPEITDVGDQRIFTWIYRGDEIYYDRALHVGFVFQVDGRANWEVEETTTGAVF
ncbi:MAG: hypothetical protein QXO20_04560 [Candidatus Bathyarchaeia archaeon]